MGFYGGGWLEGVAIAIEYERERERERDTKINVKK